MNTLDTIERLFKLGCFEVLFTRYGDGRPAIKAAQWVDGIGQSKEDPKTLVTHQKAAGTHADCLNAILHSVESANLHL